jgi:hypothetical protein
MAAHLVALQALDRGRAADAARSRLSDALGCPIPAPDATGIIEIEITADDFEAALARVWDGVASAGADDHLAFAEHPDVPEHWRRRHGDRPPQGSA